MSSNERNCCGRCLAFQPFGGVMKGASYGEYGECRANPPVLRGIYPIGPTQELLEKEIEEDDNFGGWHRVTELAKWPVVSWTDWCLRFVEDKTAGPLPDETS